MKIQAALVGMMLVTYSPSVFACGFCGGDKAASVYSFKNKRFAEKMKTRYVSAELSVEGPQEEFERAVKTIEKLPGLYPNTVRSAFAQKAVSFVLKPDTRFESVVEAFSKSHSGWSMKLVEDIK